MNVQNQTRGFALAIAIGAFACCWLGLPAPAPAAVLSSGDVRIHCREFRGSRQVRDGRPLEVIEADAIDLVQRGGLRVRAERAVVYAEKRGNEKVLTWLDVMVSGNVRVALPDLQANCARAHLRPREKILIVFGDDSATESRRSLVRVESRGLELEAPRFEVHLDQGLLLSEGPVRGQVRPPAKARASGRKPTTLTAGKLRLELPRDKRDGRCFLQAPVSVQDDELTIQAWAVQIRFEYIPVPATAKPAPASPASRGTDKEVRITRIEAWGDMSAGKSKPRITLSSRGEQISCGRVSYDHRARVINFTNGVVMRAAGSAGPREQRLQVQATAVQGRYVDVQSDPAGAGWDLRSASGSFKMSWEAVGSAQER